MILKVIYSYPALVTCYPPTTSLAATSGSSSSAAAARSPARFDPSYSHHLFYTRFPNLCTASLQSSIIGCSTMHCADLLCLLSMYGSTSSKPASYISSNKGGYSHLPS